MKRTFSITFLIAVLTVCALIAWGYQVFSRQLDHFKLDVSGALVSKLPPDTRLRIVENPDYERKVDSEFKLQDLPAELPVNYTKRGCVVEFWSCTNRSEEQKLFSVVVDRELFDKFRIIDLKLDKPTPELSLQADFWNSLKWSPNLSHQIRYLDLPWWNSSSKKLEPIPQTPELILARADSDEILERTRLNHYACEFEGFYADVDEERSLNLRDGESLVFSVTYDSGGLFESIRTSRAFQYTEEGR